MPSYAICSRSITVQQAVIVITWFCCRTRWLGPDLIVPLACSRNHFAKSRLWGRISTGRLIGALKNSFQYADPRRRRQFNPGLGSVPSHGCRDIFGDPSVRYLLLILVLTISGCGSTSWFGWQRSAPACDSMTCSECPLESAGSVRLDPAPVFQSPVMEIPIIGSPVIEGTPLPAPVPDSLPDLDSGSTAEPVLPPTPDPAT